MLTLVIGGSASGKSEYAENLAVSLRTAEGAGIYIATMNPTDEECRRRIARHREMRANKGFSTIECYTGLMGVQVPKGSVVLLECVSNLVANELYLPQGAGKDTCGAILRGVDCLCEAAAHVVVVSNQVFLDGCTYDDFTRDYLGVMAAVNNAVAQKAQRVVEVVCTIPIVQKGEEGKL